MGFFLRAMRLPVNVLLLLLLSACSGEGEGNGYCLLNECGQFEKHAYAAMKAESAPAEAPWLVLLHGSNVSLDTMERQWQARAFAQRYGFVLVLPHAVGSDWDFQGDDEVIARLVQALQVDYGRPRAVFVGGWSNGSVMAQIVACKQAGMVSGVVSHAGQITRSAAEICMPSRPVAVALLHGTNDSVVPMQGGVFDLLSLDATLAHWSARLGCASEQLTRSDAGIHVGLDAQTFSPVACTAPLQATVIDSAGHVPSWDSGIFHAYLADFFQRAMLARGE